MMLQFKAAFGTFLLLAGVAAAQSQPKDFSGVWTMDPARSESAHQDVPIGPVNLTITQSTDTLTVKTVRKGSKQSPAFEETLIYRLDGSENVVPGNAGASVTTKANWRGETLAAETTRNVENSTVTTMYLHSLAADGRELVIEKTLTVQHGYQFKGSNTTGHGKDVYVKKIN